MAQQRKRHGAHNGSDPGDDNGANHLGTSLPGGNPHPKGACTCKTGSNLKTGFGGGKWPLHTWTPRINRVKGVTGTGVGSAPLLQKQKEESAKNKLEAALAKGWNLNPKPQAPNPNPEAWLLLGFWCATCFQGLWGGNLELEPKGFSEPCR